MSSELTPEQLKQLLSQSPQRKRASKKVAREIAAIGSWEAELTLRRQNNAYHRVTSFEPREFRDIESLPKSQTQKRRRVTRDDRPQFNAATIAVTYTLKNGERWRYFYTRPIAEWADAFYRGIITEGEFDEFVENVKAMGR